MARSAETSAIVRAWGVATSSRVHRGNGGASGIERVRVLHDELARAQDARARSGLVALLRLDLVPDLRQVAVRADLARREPRDDLFVGHGQAHVALVAVLQPEHLG